MRNYHRYCLECDEERRADRILDWIAWGVGIAIVCGLVFMAVGCNASPPRDEPAPTSVWTTISSYAPGPALWRADLPEYGLECFAATDAGTALWCRTRGAMVTP